MKNILERLREREWYHDVSCAEADGMGVKESVVYHEKLAGFYRNAADSLEAALKIEESAPSATNNTERDAIALLGRIANLLNAGLCVQPESGILSQINAVLAQRAPVS